MTTFRERWIRRELRKFAASIRAEAQGTEARRAETENTGSVHDGPVAESDAPNLEAGDSHNA